MVEPTLVESSVLEFQCFQDPADKLFGNASIPTVATSIYTSYR